MVLARSAKINPRQIAGLLVDSFSDVEFITAVEIAGPGFINIHLDKTWLAGQLATANTDKNLNVSQSQNPKTVVVDFKKYIFYPRRPPVYTVRPLMSV